MNVNGCKSFITLAWLFRDIETINQLQKTEKDTKIQIMHYGHVLQYLGGLATKCTKESKI